MKNIKAYIPFVIALIISAFVIFLYQVTKVEDKNPKEVYKVYLDGKYLGAIRSKKALENYIDNEQKALKEEYDVKKVYIPNGIDIKKAITYKGKLMSEKTIYKKIKENKSFTIKGYVVTISQNEEDKENEEVKDKEYYYAIKGYIYYFGFKGVEEQNLSKAVELLEKGSLMANRMYGKPRLALVKYHGDRKKVEVAIKRHISAATGHEASDVHELAQSHQEWYKDYRRFLSVLMVFTLVALLIAVLGLMAMNSYFVGQRRREIAIRRVFGAEISGITLRLLLTVVIQSLVAIIIAIPLSYWLAPMVGSISGLTIQMELSPLLLSLVIVLAVNLLTAAFQGWHAATENPVNSIKNE